METLTVTPTVNQTVVYFILISRNQILTRTLAVCRVKQTIFTKDFEVLSLVENHIET